MINKQITIEDNKNSDLTKEKKRDSGIELLRIVLMIMILLYHFSVVFIHDTFYSNRSLFFIKLFITSGSLMAVDCFVFISGFYGMRFKLKQVVSLVLQALFYSYACLIALAFVAPDVIDVNRVIRYMLPISSSVWWFITTYILLYFLSPFLNAGINCLSKRQFQVLLVGFLYLNCFSNFLFELELAGHLLNFIFIYLLARYINIYKLKLKRPVLLYGLTVCAIFLINVIFSLSLNKAIIASGRYTSILTIFAALCLFFAFSKIKLNNSFILKISPLSLGVYLCHFNFFVWYYVIINILYHIDYICIDTPISYLYLIISLVLVVFIVSLCIEKFRQIICQPILNFINKKIDKFKLNI